MKPTIKNEEDIKNNVVFNINFNKKENEVIITEAGNDLFYNICFMQDFKKIIEKQI